MDPLTLLAHAAAEGDRAALEQLVRRTQRRVWLLCRHLGASGAADDLAQETYLRALRAIGTFRGDAPFELWLLSIARRVCADDLRRRRRRARALGRLDRPEVAQPPASPDLDELIGRLDHDRRAAFVLTQVLGFSYTEAAAVCGCPVGTIRSRVARARSDLIAALRRAEAI